MVTLSQRIEASFVGISLKIKFTSKITDLIFRFAANCRIKKQTARHATRIADGDANGHDQCKKVRIEVTAIAFR